MAELKGLGSQDPMKSSQDIESYNLEFRDLQRQLYDMSQMTFNGVSLFANFATDGTTESVFRDAADATNNTVRIHTSTQGSGGSKVSLHKAKFLAAITLEAGDLDRSRTGDAEFSQKTIVAAGSKAADTNIISFAAEDSAATTKVPPGKFKLDLTASAPAEAVSSQRTAMLQNFSSPAVSGRLSNRMTYVNSGRVGHSGINIISSSGRNVTNSSPAVSDRSRGSARVMNSSRSSGRMSSRDKATMRRRQEEISAVANLPN